MRPRTRPPIRTRAPDPGAGLLATPTNQNWADVVRVGKWALTRQPHEGSADSRTKKANGVSHANRLRGRRIRRVLTRQPLEGSADCGRAWACGCGCPQRAARYSAVAGTSPYQVCLRASMPAAENSTLAGCGHLTPFVIFKLKRCSMGGTWRGCGGLS